MGGVFRVELAATRAYLRLWWLVCFIFVGWFFVSVVFTPLYKFCWSENLVASFPGSCVSPAAPPLLGRAWHRSGKNKVATVVLAQTKQWWSCYLVSWLTLPMLAESSF